MFENRPNRSAEIALVGRSNVGKSTLMRELTGHTIATGQRPGVTRSPNHFDWVSDDFMFTDLPGFGFMAGVPEDRREQIKTNVIHYLEEHADNILVAVLVIDGKSAVDIIDRHTNEDEIPHDIEMYGFLQDIGIPTVIAVNKMDKVNDRNERLDAIADRFGLHPPWKQWQDVIAPITAKKGQINALNETIRTHLHNQKRDDLLKFF